VSRSFLVTIGVLTIQIIFILQKYVSYTFEKYSDFGKSGFYKIFQILAG